MIFHLVLGGEGVDSAEPAEPLEFPTMILVEVILHGFPGGKLLWASPASAIVMRPRLVDMGAEICLEADGELAAAGAAVNHRHVATSLPLATVATGKEKHQSTFFLQAHRSHRDFLCEPEKPSSEFWETQLGRVS